MARRYRLAVDLCCDDDDSDDDNDYDDIQT